jgi:hypothetical protein
MTDRSTRKSRRRKKISCARRSRSGKTRTPGSASAASFRSRTAFFLPYQKLADIYDLKSAGEEEVDGRHRYVVPATPKPYFRPATGDEKESLNYSMKLWLEDSKAFPVPIEGDITGEHSRMQKAATLGRTRCGSTTSG